jgi:hypothetical protein
MITREDLVSQSVMDHAVAGIAAQGYPPTQVAFLESFPYDVAGPLEKNLIAAGFDFDDGGEQAELGSALKRRLYTIEFFVFGMTATWARNLAHALKFVLEGDGRIALKDIGQPGASSSTTSPQRPPGAPRRTFASDWPRPPSARTPASSRTSPT